MPHDEARVHSLTNSGSGVLDRRRALAIAPVAKLDNGQTGNPLKIPNRRVPSGEEDCTDAVAYVGMHTKIHWTQLASNGASSHSVQHHNQAAADDDSALLDMNRRELKVILTDVLQTEVGRSYLRNCLLEPKMKHQLECKGGTRERQCERRISAGHREEGSPSRWQQMNTSDFSTTNIHYGKQLETYTTEKKNTRPTKETKSPLLTNLKRFHNSPKQTEPTSSDKKELWSEELANHHSEDDELCPLEESDCSSPLNSEGTDIAECWQSPGSTFMETPRQTPSRLNLSGRRYRVGHSRGEGRPSQHTTVEEMSKDGGGKRREKQQQKEESHLDRNGEMREDWGGARRSVLRLSAGAVGSQSEMGLIDGEVPPKRIRLQSPLEKTSFNPNSVEVRKSSNPHTPEPIVLSSEEEEEKEKNSSTLRVQTLGGAKVPHTPQRLAHAIKRKKVPGPLAHTLNMHTQVRPTGVSRRCVSQVSNFVDSAFSRTSEIELQFSALHMGGFSAFSNGLIKITEDRITIILKDHLGSEVKAFLLTESVRKYSVWDGLMVQDSGLVKDNQTPPPSLLLLWLSEVQARRLFSDLSVTQPSEGSTCVLLCACEELKGVQGALLASIMDIVGIKHGTTSLLSALSHSESLKLLHSECDTQLLQLLRPRAETHATAPETCAATSADTPLVKDSDVQANSVYTLCHSRTKGTYSVSMAPRPGASWNPYRHRGPAHRLIQFPPPPSKGAITVTTEDLECLDSGEFLNDVIIDFYLKYLLVQKAPHSSVRRSHVFSSFFYKQLTRRDNANEDSTSTPTQLRRHQRVKTWTRHVDIFDKDFLFVPVNQEAHWYLVVICFPGMEQPQYVDREGQGLVPHENSSDSTAGTEPQEVNRASANGDRPAADEAGSMSVSAPGPPNCTEKTCKQQTVCKRPCILIMDSLKLSVHERIFKLLREYLQAEWEVKRGGYRDFSAERMVGSHCKVPLQDNSSDCGLYLLQYAESFLQDPVVHFDLPLKLDCWFPRQQVREKREEIRDLVLYLYRFQQSSEDRLETGTVIQ